MGGELIVCPSGFAGEIRGLTGNDARLLSDRQALRNGTFLDKLLGSCWLKTTEVGPYGFGADGKPDWSKVLIGDRVFILIKIRARSFGPLFQFKVQCTNTSCRAKFDHEVDVNELPVRQLSEEDRQAFANGNRIEGTLPEGLRCIFRLLTGADETKALKAGANAMTTFLGPLMARIVEIEGMKEHEKRAYFEQGELSLAYAALEEMDAHDCGVETSLSIECPDCREAMDIEIPFGQGFLAPIGKRPT